MNKSLQNILQYGVSALLAIILLYFAFQNINFNELIQAFREANYFWILVSLFLGILSHWSRAVRWKLLLKPLGYKPSTFKAFLAVMVGYFMNFVVPRAGEVVRCGTIQRLSGVPADTAFGTVVLERLIDVLMLGLMLLVLIIVELNHLSSFFLSFLGNKMAGLQNLLWIGLIFLLICVAFIFALVLSWKRLKQSPLFEKINKILLNVLSGILSIQKLENKFAFIFHTLFIWFLYYLMAYVLFFCFEKTENLDLWFGFIVLVMGAIGMATPVQGGFGAYHILVGNVFALRGLSVNDGIILATFMHTVQTLIVLSVGGLSFLIVMYLVNKISKVGKL